MKVHFLGTCSGTEPMPGMHQVSLVMEINETLYWFDAGECCGYTAYLMGLDVCKMRALFVSHPHVDHTGGLSHLLFVMKKLRKPLIHNNTLEVYIPDLDCLHAAMHTSWDTRAFDFTINGHETHDGLLYEDENIGVTALHNTHLKEDGSTGWHSFSFLIEAEGKRIVYSGDTRRPDELDLLLEKHCDMFIMETGHHKVQDVCEYALSKDVSRLRFVHHGREIINGRDAAEALTAQYAEKSGMSIVICNDGTTEEL